MSDDPVLGRAGLEAERVAHLCVVVDYGYVTGAGLTVAPISMSLPYSPEMQSWGGAGTARLFRINVIEPNRRLILFRHRPGFRLLHKSQRRHTDVEF